ncbi:hypothetical protein GCM10007276_08940 [Agaricicola taiwanensis]|uniref:Uncharacterized protein n=1 Tax=Agaricicola taiwanensis TaxID=591372 RepID=A0A8J2VQY5_9RHOB|nr:hypothetical protein [Agaricicola taiwanensis]GGE33809.1 hypothetical protein GCM10007276_08940 [Agaricicola taiwanensis]
MNAIDNGSEEYVTIIAPSAGEAMAQFKARGLDEQGFLIAGRIGRHQFSLVSGTTSTTLFADENLVAATFSRTIAR